ncbi:hypothetical protein BGZ60DRAFT_534047 [Tricladium varicosporioides]|nr:hypothetical protein BGZ60DRAFT_534047 [Hymenoscyphus varicosporioides]
MGTDVHLSTTIRWSGSKKAPHIEHINIHFWNFGTSGGGFMTAGKAVTRERISMPSKFTFEIHKDIYDTFNDHEKAHVMVYDNGTKIAWYLPQTSVVLHIVYRIIQRRKYQLFDGEKPTTLRHLGADTTCAGAALHILKSSLDYRVFKHESKSEVVEECLSRTIKQVWHLLDTIRDKLWSVVDEFENVGKGRARLKGQPLASPLFPL